MNRLLPLAIFMPGCSGADSASDLGDSGDAPYCAADYFSLVEDEGTASSAIFVTSTNPEVEPPSGLAGQLQASEGVDADGSLWLYIEREPDFFLDGRGSFYGEELEINDDWRLELDFWLWCDDLSVVAQWGGILLLGLGRTATDNEKWQYGEAATQPPPSLQAIDFWILRGQYRDGWTIDEHKAALELLAWGDFHRGW